MAKVFLTLKSAAKTKSSTKAIKLLENHQIPFEQVGTVLYLISQEAYQSGVDIKSREYSKPYSNFCMQLSDSTTGGSIGMGEGGLQQDVINALFKVFGETLNFEFTLSCNSDVENKSAKIVLDKKNRCYVFETVIEDISDAEEEADYHECSRCGGSYLANTECECSKIETKIVAPPLKFKDEVENIRLICKEMEEKKIAYVDWADFLISKGYKAKLNINLEISSNTFRFRLANKVNKLPPEINFIEGKFAGWLPKK